MDRITHGVPSLLLAALFLLPSAAAAGDRKGPSDKEVKRMIEFGISLGRQGLWKEALYRWKEALRYDPDNPKLLNNIAVALESQGDLEGARQAYNRARELDDSARYIERNIADFEELFTALQQYEEQYRKPPESAGGEAAAGGDGEKTEPGPGTPSADTGAAETVETADAAGAGEPAAAEADGGDDGGEAGPPEGGEAAEPPTDEEPPEENP